MKYNDLQISAIKIFGKKDLNQGLLMMITLPNGNKIEWRLFEHYDSEDVGGRIFEIPLFGKYGKVTDTEILYNKSFEILGHEPHLEDVFRVAEEKEILFDIEKHGLEKGYCLYFYTPYTNNIEYNPTIQLLEQSEETLEKLISLFK